MKSPFRHAIRPCFPGISRTRFGKCRMCVPQLLYAHSLICQRALRKHRFSKVVYLRIPAKTVKVHPFRTRFSAVFARLFRCRRMQVSPWEYYRLRVRQRGLRKHRFLQWKCLSVLTKASNGQRIHTRIHGVSNARFRPAGMCVFQQGNTHSRHRGIAPRKRGYLRARRVPLQWECCSGVHFTRVSLMF